MAKTYDTVVFRQGASSIESASEKIASAVGNTLSWILEDMPGHLAGEAANALGESVTDLREQLLQYGKSLEETAMVLRKYAVSLDEADRKAAERIQTK